MVKALYSRESLEAVDLDSLTEEERLSLSLYFHINQHFQDFGYFDYHKHFSFQRKGILILALNEIYVFTLKKVLLAFHRRFLGQNLECPHCILRAYRMPGW